MLELLLFVRRSKKVSGIIVIREKGLFITTGIGNVKYVHIEL